MDFPKGTPCQFFFWIAAIFALFWRATPPKKGEERYFSSGNPSSRSFYSPLKGAGGPVGTQNQVCSCHTNPNFFIPKFEIHYLTPRFLLLTLYGLVQVILFTPAGAGGPVGTQNQVCSGHTNPNFLIPCELKSKLVKLFMGHILKAFRAKKIGPGWQGGSETNFGV